MQDDVDGGNGSLLVGAVGHFYFAQIGHFYFAATQPQGRHNLRAVELKKLLERRAEGTVRGRRSVATSSYNAKVRDGSHSVCFTRFSAALRCQDPLVGLHQIRPFREPFPSPFRSAHWLPCRARGRGG